MRRWRSWKWRLAGVGDEKGRSGPDVRICERERRAVASATEVEPGQQQLPWSKCMIAGRPRRLSGLIENDRSVPLRGPIPRYTKPTLFYDPSLPLDCSEA